ncbi:MAG: 30S ribosomal protein S12 methylthiotransferase RimO [Oscillospiraceae bacterium]|nr:30S ribosomal protein S12 methylthiotransferase RimO [Oscillospiraceae bacterium]
MIKTVGLISLGCAKNLINSEQMLCLLSEAGYGITSDPAEADALIINTCAFIDSAKSEAIDNILECAELKKTGKLKTLLVAGCLPQRYKEELLRELPEVDGILGTGAFDEVVAALEQADAGEKPLLLGDLNAPVSEAGRIVSTGPGWAYLKIAEGCDNRCAFCVIPSIRGRYRSRPMERILEEAKGLAAGGVKELLVVAQDITRYGLDLYGRPRLAELVRELCRIDGIHWIRLHYLYPDLIDDELIRTVAEEEKVVKYLDIPIQHINDGILKRMNRRGSGAELEALLTRLRERIPGLVIRTSLITGLPGEGVEEFGQLCDFLRRAKLERAGVFPYSPEEGTPACSMERPDTETAERRCDLITELQSRIMDEFNESRLGTVQEVLAEGFDVVAECWYGRSYADSPDVDGKVFFTGKNVQPGSFVRVRINEVLDGDLVGELAD